jgi:hypothetical protein
VGQTGIYSFFALAGDCEVVLGYELLAIAPPRSGMGSGLGLVLDAGEGIGVGAIRRVKRPAEGDGYVLQTVPGGPGGDVKDEDRFVLARDKRGKIGLRREGKELVFLAADGPNASLEEIDRLRFTTATIRSVRVFADNGGSPTALDVRVKEMPVRAEQIAMGAPPKPPATDWGRWGWALLAVTGLVLLAWLWRAYHRWSEDEVESGPKRVRPTSQA